MTKHFYIVTPSFNAAPYIDRAIMGIISQAGNFTIHYHVQDGGSTDGTQEKLAAWQHLLTKSNPIVQCERLTFSWASEPDCGMYQAINRGFTSFGDIPDDGILAWGNTDDSYLPLAFSTVAKIFNDLPSLYWMGGAILIETTKGLVNSDPMQPYPPELVKNGCCDARAWRHLNQASIFWSRKLWEQAGPLREDVRYAGDYELWSRFAHYTNFIYLPVPLAIFMKRAEQLSKATDEQGLCHYELEKELILPYTERERLIRRFWMKRIRPPKGPILQQQGNTYCVIHTTAWASWGQGWQFYRYRLKYYWRQIKGLPKKLHGNLTIWLTSKLLS